MPTSKTILAAIHCVGGPVMMNVNGCCFEQDTLGVGKSADSHSHRVWQLRDEAAETVCRIISL